MIKEIGEPAMLEMLAEELVECAHEALKLARPRKQVKSITFHGHALYKEGEQDE